MAKLARLAGSTSHILTLFCQDSSSTTGAGLAGLAYNTASLTCYYKRNTGTAAVSVTLVDIATLGTFVGGGFKAIDGANMPGCVEFHPPDAAYAPGAKSVVFMIKGAANLAPVLIEVELTAVDNQDAVRGGMTALPNTAVTTNASLLTSGTGTDQVSVSSGKVLLQATQAGVTITTVTNLTNAVTVADKSGFKLAADGMDLAIVEGNTTVVASMRGWNSVLLAKASGMGTGTVAFRDMADSKARVTATCDASGNRSSVTRDLT